MHILVVADGRSPIARRYLQALVERGYRVSLVSSFPCEQPDLGRSGELARFDVLPVAFSQYASGGGRPASAPASAGLKAGGVRGLVRRFRSLFLAGRYVLGPLSVQNLAEPFADRVAEIQPDLVHAMRIPYEGMLACATPPQVPLVVSIWGNDLTLHAKGSPSMAAFTRKAFKRADGLLADAARDLRLAVEWGFSPEAPALVVPGSGGIRLDEIGQAEQAPLPPGMPFGPDCPLVINPRGVRPGSVRTDTFFRAIPLLLAEIPEARFVCPSLAGQAEAERWVAELKVAEEVALLPVLPQPELWAFFRRAQVFVSPSAHDGTPNSLLESMACGCFPVAGDIESLREWITPGVNGMLIPPDDPQALADAICLALARPGLRANAARLNQRIIRERAAVDGAMERVGAFYQAVCAAKEIPLHE
jgi:hypothetical protein